MKLRSPYRALCILAFLTMAAPAWASANVSCRIDDAIVSFDLEAIAGRAGPITQVQTGRIKIKAAAGAKAQTGPIAIDRSHIIQQWDLSDELRLQIEVTDEATHQTINLVILGRRVRSRDQYSGPYVLKVSRDGETKKFTGRIRQCVAG